MSESGTSPDPTKVDSILSAEQPETATELRGFLGLVRFVGRYVCNLAIFAAPLCELTKNPNAFNWSEVHQESFDKIKQLMGATHTLAYFDKEA